MNGDGYSPALLSSRSLLYTGIKFLEISANIESTDAVSGRERSPADLLLTYLQAIETRHQQTLQITAQTLIKAEVIFKMASATRVEPFEVI